jgi:hypothetical protein
MNISDIPTRIELINERSRLITKSKLPRPNTTCRLRNGPSGCGLRLSYSIWSTVPTQPLRSLMKQRRKPEISPQQPD